MVYLPSLGSHPATILFKCIGQFFMTLRILFGERPSAVFIMAPPIFAPLTGYIFKLLTGTPFVIDAHTAAYMHQRWIKFQWLQRFLERQAATTIVTNDHLAANIRAHGAHATIVQDVPIIYEDKDKFEMNDNFSVAIVCSFNSDEPVEQIYEAVAQVDNVDFYMTGNPKFLDKKIAGKKPDNVKLTGFVSNSAYGHLIQNAGAVMTLTTRDHTMLRAAWEAIYQGTPVIISDWQILRKNFSEGAIHTDNSAQSIANAIRDIRDNQEMYKKEAQALRDKKYKRWAKTKETLQDRLSLVK